MKIVQMLFLSLIFCVTSCNFKKDNNGKKENNDNQKIEKEKLSEKDANEDKLDKKNSTARAPAGVSEEVSEKIEAV